MNMKSLSSLSSVSFGLGLVAMLATASGCSSKASTDDALNKLKSPTGSFTEGNGSAALGGYSGASSDSSDFQSAGVGGQSANGALGIRNAVLGATGRGTATTQALDILSGNARVTANCSGDSTSATCNCPGGGSFDVEAERDGDDIRATGSYDNCKNGDVKFDGDIAFLMSKRELLPAKKLGKGITGLGGYNVLFNMKGTVSTPKRTADVDVAFLAQGGGVWLSVTVNDGNITMGVGGNVIEVKTKNGTVTCTGTATSYTCETESGQPFTFNSDVKLGG
jgi:hypothetical protein